MFRKLAEHHSPSAFSNLDEALRKQQQRRREINSVAEDSGMVNSAYTGITPFLFMRLKIFEMCLWIV